MKKKSGFTLIELLIVISIISFLTSVVFGSLNNARVNARDAQRISDIRQMRIALELYRNANGDYPVIGLWANSSDSSWNTLQTALAPYMPKLPKDPKNTGPDPYTNGVYSYAYAYTPASTYPSKKYDLLTQFENTSNPNRCELKSWLFRYYDNTSWCGAYSPYIYTGEY